MCRWKYLIRRTYGGELSSGLFEIKVFLFGVVRRPEYPNTRIGISLYVFHSVSSFVEWGQTRALRKVHMRSLLFILIFHFRLLG